MHKAFTVNAVTIHCLLYLKVVRALVRRQLAKLCYTLTNNLRLVIENEMKKMKLSAFLIFFFFIFNNIYLFFKLKMRRHILNGVVLVVHTFQFLFYFALFLLFPFSARFAHIIYGFLSEHWLFTKNFFLYVCVSSCMCIWIWYYCFNADIFRIYYKILNVFRFIYLFAYML